jgi:hypothetical protein
VIRPVIELGGGIEGGAQIRAALELLVHADLLYLAGQLGSCRHYPSLYESGVRYARAQRGPERWLVVPDVLSRGYGDCDQLVAWRIAELRLGGEHATVRLTAPPWLRGTLRTWHATVRRGDGSIEDPSSLLGMNSDSDGG